MDGCLCAAGLLDRDMLHRTLNETNLMLGVGGWILAPRLLALMGASPGVLAIGIPILLLVGIGWLALGAAPEGSSLALAARLLLFLAPAALWEELAFRGVIQESLGRVLGVGQCSADDLYRALDWLHDAQPAIERRLARYGADAKACQLLADMQTQRAQKQLDRIKQPRNGSIKASSPCP